MTPLNLRRLNDVFGRELGRNKHGDPNYKWQWSEDFLHHMVIEGKRDWSIEPGGNIYAPRPMTQLRKMCPWLNNQWLITKYYWGPESEWVKQFGSSLEWPRRGFYLFVDNTDLPHGVEPTLHITNSFVNGMRCQMGKTLADVNEEMEKGLALEQKHIDNHIYDVLDDATNAFGAAKPGSRNGGVSVPTPEFTRHYDKILETCEEAF